jgi:hypothetical protein
VAVRTFLGNASLVGVPAASRGVAADLHLEPVMRIAGEADTVRRLRRKRTQKVEENMELGSPGRPEPGHEGAKTGWIDLDPDIQRPA